jgi:two-component system, OmpR family, response regulator QseB
MDILALGIGPCRVGSFARSKNYGRRADRDLVDLKGQPPGVSLLSGTRNSLDRDPQTGICMKVLLVEDHAAMREMISDHLVERGFTVDAVGGAEEARAALAVASYDALVLDLGLPDADGMELLREARARTARRLPALIVTARDALDDRARGLNAGADDYIVKPFELAELEARLRAVLRRPGVRQDVILAYGALAFDTVSREVSVGGILLDLSRREAALLEELLRAAGRIVVKDTLEDRLYALDQSVTGNALEAVVSRVRKKLSAAHAGVCIDTKRGVGYRLLAGEHIV